MADGDITLSVTLEASDIRAKSTQLRESISKMMKGADPTQLTKGMQDILVKMDELVSKSVEVETAVEQMENTLVDNPAFTQLESEIASYEKTLQGLDQSKQNAFKLGLPTDQIEAEIARVEKAYGEALAMREQMSQAGQDTITWAQADPDLYNRQLNSLGSLNNQMTVLTARYQQLGQAASATNPQVQGTTRAFNQASKASSKMASSIKGSAKHFGKSLQQAFSLRSINHFIRRIASLAFGVYSLTAVFNKLKSAAKAGLDNLVQYQSSTNATNKAMTSLQTSLLYLKNAWGAAFAPIINIVMPYLTTLINGIATVGNYIARLVGALTGQEKVLQAVKVSAGDYAASLGKATKNAGSAAKAQKKLNDRLAQFDDLNVLGKDDKDTGSGGAGAGAGASSGPNPNDMFEYVDVDKSEFKGILDFIEEIKQKIKESGIVEAFERLKKAFDDFKDSPIVKTLEEIIGFLADTAFTSTLSILTNLFNLLADILNGDLKTGLQDFKKLLADLTFDPLIALAGVIDKIFGTDIAGWIKKVKKAIEDIDLSKLPGYEKMVSALEDLRVAWDNFKGAIKDFWDMLEETGVLEYLERFIVKVVEIGFDALLNTIAFILTIIGDALQLIADILNGDWPAVLDDIKNTLADLNYTPLETVADILDDICGTDISGWLEDVHQSIEDIHFEDFVQSIVDGWEAIKSAFWLGVGVIAAALGLTDDRVNLFISSITEAFNDFSATMQQTFSDIGSAAINAFVRLVEGVKKVFSTLAPIIKPIINTIISAMNKLIGGLERMLNGLADVLNEIKIDIPNWVPQWGGKQLKFNLKTVTLRRIPELAQGAVIPPNKEFMAVLGDQSHGTNIEAPLDTIKQAVAEVMGTGGNAEVIALLQQLIAVVESKNLVIGDKEIAKANARYTNQQKIIRGASF